MNQTELTKAEKKELSRPMRIGLVARADNTGLGIQTWEFYRHLAKYVSRIMIIDLSYHNGQQGRSVGMDVHRYPLGKSMIIEGVPTEGDIDKFLDSVDIVFTCETPYNYYLFYAAAQRGIPTVLQFNYEFLDYLNRRDLPFPTELWAPSSWHLTELNATRLGIPPGLAVNLIPAPVPVDRKRLPFKLRRKATKFLHLAGRPAYQDRNGTAIVLAAMEYVKSPIELTVRFQVNGADTKFIDELGDDRIKVVKDDEPDYWKVYGDNDVLLMPRKYGGLCLPLNEASSLGMPVIMSNVPPQNGFLNDAAMVDVFNEFEVTTRSKFMAYEVDPRVLAAKIDELYENPKTVEFLSEMSNRYAAGIAWDVQAAEYAASFARCLREARS